MDIVIYHKLRKMQAEKVWYAIRCGSLTGNCSPPDPDHVKMMRTIATGKSLDPRDEIAGR